MIGRLPRYFRYLGELKRQGVERISSQELSRLMKVTASQIRQDLNNFGGFGQQGYGYNTSFLYDEISKILGLEKQHDMILVGAGNLGQALLNYMKFRTQGFCFRAAFDVDPALFGRKFADIEVFPLDTMADYVRQNSIDIAVLTLPKSAAREVADMLVQCNIKAFWNFAHIDLTVPDEIQVENVHLQDSLLKLSYNMKRQENGFTKEKRRKTKKT